jgi:alpha-L-rhamnosidase
VRGLIRSGWQRDGESRRLTLDVTVPPNTSAEVWLPGGARGEARVRESGVILDREQREGARRGAAVFVRAEEGWSIFDVGAGQYSFEVESC